MGSPRLHSIQKFDTSSSLAATHIQPPAHCDFNEKEYLGKWETELLYDPAFLDSRRIKKLYVRMYSLSKSPANLSRVGRTFKSNSIKPCNSLL